MSKIARKPMVMPEGVEAKLENKILSVKGKLGELRVFIPSSVVLEIEGKEIKIVGTAKNKQARADLGTTAAHIKNAITGVSEGFRKELELQGVGYRVAMEGSTLVMSVGFSHPVRLESPEGIEIKTEKNNISVSGIDRQLVGQVAAKIRSVKKPEPYLGKGIRYVDEVVRRKQGKKVAGTGAQA